MLRAGERVPYLLDSASDTCFIKPSRMFTQYLSPAFACLFLFALPARAGRPVNEIRAAAEKEANALVHGDYDTVADFTYPRIVELSGGRPGLKKLLSSGFADMKTKGISLASTVIGEPGPLVRSGAKLYSVVPATVVIKAPGTKITQPSYLLGSRQIPERPGPLLTGPELILRRSRKLFQTFLPT